MSAKKKQELTLASYQGLASRLCDKLGITPSFSGETVKTEVEFQALCDWCQQEDKQNRILAAKRRFGA